VTPKEDLVSIRVRPRSSRSGLGLDAEGRIVVHVHAPATEGAANRECIAAVAKALKVPKSAVQIVRGHKSRSKQVAVEGLEAEQVGALLQRAAAGK